MIRATLNRLGINARHGRNVVILAGLVAAAVVAALLVRVDATDSPNSTSSPRSTQGGSLDVELVTETDESDLQTDSAPAGEQSRVEITATTSNSRARAPVVIDGNFGSVRASTQRDASKRSARTYIQQDGPTSSEEEDELAMPEWERIITPDGGSVDMVGARGRQGSNGVPDHVELYAGIEAGYVEDIISNGVASDSSALLIARDVSDEVLYNGAVRPEHDLGNVLYLLNHSPTGHFRIYVGVERLLSDLPTFIEFEFNQDLMQVGSGIPWWEIQGARHDGDLLVRFNLIAGRLTSVELAQWQNNAYFIFESDTQGLSSGCRDRFSYIYCLGVPPLDRSNQLIEVWGPDYEPVVPTLPDSFAELGLDLDRLALTTREFSGVYIRTPEDVVMTSFRAIGVSASEGLGAP